MCMSNLNPVHPSPGCLCIWCLYRVHDESMSTGESFSCLCILGKGPIYTKWSSSTSMVRYHIIPRANLTPVPFQALYWGLFVPRRFFLFLFLVLVIVMVACSTSFVSPMRLEIRPTPLLREVYYLPVLSLTECLSKRCYTQVRIYVYNRYM